jgi:hypothetical protein
LILFAVDGLCRELGNRSWRVVYAGGLLLGLQLGSALWIAPHYLSYFNPLLCRPEQGYRYLVDSNLDWGQDLPELARTFARLHAARPRLAYFGTAAPKAYGVDAKPWDEPGGDYLAVSATYLQGVGLAGDPFAELRGLPPDARAGHSLFVYDLRRDDVRAARFGGHVAGQVQVVAAEPRHEIEGHQAARHSHDGQQDRRKCGTGPGQACLRIGQSACESGNLPDGV